MVYKIDIDFADIVILYEGKSGRFFLSKFLFSGFRDLLEGFFIMVKLSRSSKVILVFKENVRFTGDGDNNI